ncbi:hypothetical protein HHI36_020119 [Cryptolaemus montrouzieri]|uniref:Discoidin domain-containing protein n=1 Tax=Cryptolaemus montrouzieri TaxID=559131 RepID=A0ABD2NA24_9CUCU
MPQGNREGEFDLSDKTYDGLEEAGHLSQGLGQLVDGRLGQDNFRLDLAGNGKGYEWIGWKNDTPGWAGHPLELLFEFDKLRNFSAAHLHTNNLFSKEVQVFSHARAFFSTTPNLFNGEAVHFSYMPDLVLEHARNVTIKLHQRVGRWIKLQLYFASRWILLSEISFDSAPVTANFTERPEEDADLTSTETGREYPPQRDEVKRTQTRRYRNNVTSSVIAPKLETAGEGSKHHYIGFVIGALTVVILVLVAAIVFIVFRNYRIKTSASLSGLPVEDDKPAENEKVGVSFL